MIRRRPGESVFVGENVEVQVLEIAGNRVKLGISAPRDVLVLRGELKLTEEFNREASRAVASSQMCSLASTMPKGAFRNGKELLASDNRSGSITAAGKRSLRISGSGYKVLSQLRRSSE